MTWKKYLPKSQGFCRIKKTEFLILDKVELSSLFTLASLSTYSTATTATKNLPTNDIVSQANQNNLRQLQVFFPKTPQSNQDFTYVEAVTRRTNRKDIANFAIEQLIAGPTKQERQKGLIAPISFRGKSTCGGKNFTISTSKGTARLKLCRTVPTAGIGDDARIKTAVEKTLKQFSGVKSVVILDEKGNCFKDASGLNQCLKPST